MIGNLIKEAARVAAIAVLRNDRWFAAVCADAELAKDYAREVRELRLQVDTLARLLDSAERKAAVWRQRCGMLSLDTTETVQ